MKYTFDLPESVILAAQGHDFTVNPADFAPVAIEGILVYGIRRWFQDAINSQAHAWRKATESGEVSGEFDTIAAFAARLNAAKTGQLSTPRASGTTAPAFTPLEDAVYAVAVEVKGKVKPLASAWNESKGATTTERKRAILAAVDALPTDIAAKIKAAAQVRVDALSALDF